jgi:hypothetical protein
MPGRAVRLGAGVTPYRVRMTHQDPEGLPEGGGTGKAAAGLFEGFLRDAMVNGTVLLSLVVAVAGFIAGESWEIALGLAIGVPGMVLPWVAVGRKWPISRTWTTVFAVIVVDAIALTVMWT